MTALTLGSMPLDAQTTRELTVAAAKVRAWTEKRNTLIRAAFEAGAGVREIAKATGDALIRRCRRCHWEALVTRMADLEALCVDYKRAYDQVCREHKALTEQVIAALSTPEHHHEMRGGMPFCSCWHSLRGDEGRALDVLIEHLLDVVRKERDAK